MDRGGALHALEEEHLVQHDAQHREAGEGQEVPAVPDPGAAALST